MRKNAFTDAAGVDYSAPQNP